MKEFFLGKLVRLVGYESTTKRGDQKFFGMNMNVFLKVELDGKKLFLVQLQTLLKICPGSCDLLECLACEAVTSECPQGIHR